MITHKDSALTKSGEKIKAIQDRNFDAISIVCPFGGRMLDSKQKMAADTIGEKLNMPVFYLTQLIGLAINKKEDKLGLNLNLMYDNILDK
jgi:heterodisulfide reductase subunit B